MGTTVSPAPRSVTTGEAATKLARRAMGKRMEEKSIIEVGLVLEVVRWLENLEWGSRLRMRPAPGRDFIHRQVNLA